MQTTPSSHSFFLSSFRFFPLSPRSSSSPSFAFISALYIRVHMRVFPPSSSFSPFSFFPFFFNKKLYVPRVRTRGKIRRGRSGFELFLKLENKPVNYRRDTSGTRMYIRRRYGYNLEFNPVPRRTLRFLARFNGGIFYGRLDACTSHAFIHTWVLLFLCCAIYIVLRSRELIENL